MIFPQSPSLQTSDADIVGWTGLALVGPAPAPGGRPGDQPPGALPAIGAELAVDGNPYNVIALMGEPSE